MSGRPQSSKSGALTSPSRHQQTDAEVGKEMLYTTNEDVPGIIGQLGQILGTNKINIANFTLGRSEIGGEAIALLYLDGPITSDAVNQLKDTGMFKQVKPLAFDITK